MKINKKISVCIAVHNGELYIKKQLDTILSQLSFTDEIIIVDDCSKDNSVSVINALNDNRIQIILLKKNVGHVKAFSIAIQECTGDIIFLSDQDDYWEPDRVSNLINTLISTNSLLINSSFAEVNSQGQENINNILRVGKSNRFINIINIFFGNVYYFGNTFCFKSDLKKFILPIPSWVEAHDLYIGLMANIVGKVEHFNEITIYRTIHKNNLTSKTRRSLVKIIKSRILMILIIFNGLKKSFR